MPGLPDIAGVTTGKRATTGKSVVETNPSNVLRWTAEHGVTRNYMQKQIVAHGHGALPIKSQQSKWVAKFRSLQGDWDEERQEEKLVAAEEAASAKSAQADKIAQDSDDEDISNRQDWEKELKSTVQPAENWKEAWGRNTMCDVEGCCLPIMPADSVECKYCNVRAHAWCAKMPTPDGVATMWICQNCIFDIKSSKIEMDTERSHAEEAWREKQSSKILQKAIRGVSHSTRATQLGPLNSGHATRVNQLTQSAPTDPRGAWPPSLQMNQRRAYSCSQAGATKLCSILRGRVARRRLNAEFGNVIRPFKIKLHGAKGLYAAGTQTAGR
jgi:hypothetical protein